jgi:hypothetical protein
MTERFEDIPDAKLFGALYRTRAKLLQIRGAKQFSDRELYSTRSPLFIALAGKELGESKLGQCTPTFKSTYTDDEIKQVATKAYNCLQDNKKRVQTFSNYMGGVLREEQSELFPELSEVAQNSKYGIGASDDDSTFKSKLKQATEDCSEHISSGKITLPDFHFCLLASTVPKAYQTCESKSSGDFADCVLADKHYQALEKRMPSDFAYFTRVFAKEPFAK